MSLSMDMQPVQEIIYYYDILQSSLRPIENVISTLKILLAIRGHSYQLSPTSVSHLWRLPEEIAAIRERDTSSRQKSISSLVPCITLAPTVERASCSAKAEAHVEKKCLIEIIEYGLTIIETRRLRADQIEVLKLLNGYENIDNNIFFSLKKDSTL